MQRDEKIVGQMLHRLHYLQKGQIGKGGQAIVYLVESLDGRRGEGRPASLACKTGLAEIIRREALLLKQLRHPLFPAFEEYRELEGRGFLFMEYVCGRTLESYIDTGRISLCQLESWSRQLAEAILTLHHMPAIWIYRDLKPANIVIREDGRLKLVDLGCTCILSEAGQSLAGTPEYSAPEQFAAPELVGEASDLYGYGKLLEQMLRICRVRGLRQWLQYRRWHRICHSCLHPDIDRRPNSAQQILTSVQKYSKQH